MKDHPKPQTQPELAGKSDQTPPRYIELQPRRAPLGRLRTDDEARLAAEIEKLR
jgi:hypothetical protein